MREFSRFVDRNRNEEGARRRGDQREIRVDQVGVVDVQGDDAVLKDALAENGVRKVLAGSRDAVERRVDRREHRLPQLHVGHIGVLGVDRRGEEYYQLTLGGSPDETASIGTIVGPAFSSDTVVDAIETIVDTYMDVRQENERFLDTYRRVGKQPFKEKLYAAA